MKITKDENDKCVIDLEGLQVKVGEGVGGINRLFNWDVVSLVTGGEFWCTDPPVHVTELSVKSSE